MLLATTRCVSVKDWEDRPAHPWTRLIANLVKLVLFRNDQICHEWRSPDGCFLTAEHWKQFGSERLPQLQGFPRHFHRLAKGKEEPTQLGRV